MPKLFASHDENDLVRAERDVRATFEGLDLDLGALAAVSNVFRAVWGEMDARSLAAEAGVTAATLTGVMKTLEARHLLKRGSDRIDGRRVMVSITTQGRQAVDEIMPAFNKHEALVNQALTEQELDDLARYLRVVLRTVDAIDL